MEETFMENSPAYENVNAGYADQWSLLNDLFALLDYRLYLLYKYHRWVGPGNNMQNMLGLVVTRQEFEHKLGSATEAALPERITADERSQLTLNEDYMARRMERTGAEIPLLALFRRFGLDPFERQCVILAYAAHVDRKYEKLFGYLQDDVTKKLPTSSLAVQLYGEDGASMTRLLASFAAETPFTRLFDRDRLREGTLLLKGTVLEYLSGLGVREADGLRLYEGDGASGKPLFVNQDVARELSRFVWTESASMAVLTGEPGSGKRYLVERAMDDTAGRCLFVDVQTEGMSRVREGATLARLLDAHLCLWNVDALENDEPIAIAESAMTAGQKLFLLSKTPLHYVSRCPAVTLELPETAPAGVLALFRGYLGDTPLDPGLSLPEVAVKFRFTPGQVRNAVFQAKAAAELTGNPVDAKTLHECCYRQVVHRLGELAVKVPPRFTFEDVVMPEAQKRLMRQACAHIRHKHRVYDEWGFDGKISYGRGLSMLFAGPPGTGKTMCAQVIARELNMEMYKIQLSQIVSKYIGETEKNLHAVFREARKSNCILFFDECDALFGKRSDVKDAHDRHANVEVAYLLQQIEEHEGVSIMATNLLQNIDEAFMRRITYIIHFPFPDEGMRKRLFMGMVPRGMPVSENIDWDFMAEKFVMAGGNIKNIVLAAAFLAAEDGNPLNMRHLVNAAVNEMKKNEIVVVREDLCEYADYIE